MYFHSSGLSNSGLEKIKAAILLSSKSMIIKAMGHETAHSMLHDKEVNKDILAPAKDRNTKEVEAESVACTVCQHFGIDTSE